jgi:hypothetical protein
MRAISAVIVRRSCPGIVKSKKFPAQRPRVIDKAPGRPERASGCQDRVSRDMKTSLWTGL